MRLRNAAVPGDGEALGGPKSSVAVLDGELLVKDVDFLVVGPRFGFVDIACSSSVGDVTTSSAVVQQPESDSDIPTVPLTSPPTAIKATFHSSSHSLSYSSAHFSSYSSSSSSECLLECASSESIPSESAESFDGRDQAIKRYEPLKNCFESESVHMLESDCLRRHVSALLLFSPCVTPAFLELI